ncbi:MAG: glycogen/starch/alpha-glucan phosphorylase [Acidobacteriota bacterium]
METRKKLITDNLVFLQNSLRRHMRFTLGRREDDLTARDKFMVTALAVRDQLFEKLLETEDRYEQRDAKRLYYLSMEFLMGRALSNSLYNLNLYDGCKLALMQMGIDLEEVVEQEKDAALGNGGLGRLAACFLDSLATMNYPGFGYGINYDYGLFQQQIKDGYQKEKPDHWKASGSPWLIERPDEAVFVPVYGQIEHTGDRDNHYNPMWMNWQVIIGIPYDMPIVGYGGKTVNYLRLYSAVSSDEFDMEIFNQGDYLKAVEQKIASENVSKVLYPSDAVESGRELRLIQEYFLVACSVRDIVNRYLKTHDSFDEFPNKVAIQINDTHPALVVAELMRYFIDEMEMEWDKAWEITLATLGYTNHTLLPEALERWSVALFERVLPRHLQIIYEINRRFLESVANVFPEDQQRFRRMSIIEEGDEKQIRMGHLALVGSHSVNGVAALHTDLVKKNLFKDFYDIYPERFNNKTNGVTQRRWLLKANPKLAELINSKIGAGWITDLTKLQGLEPLATNRDFQKDFRRIKRENKIELAQIIKETTGFVVNPDSMFDIQAKRIHEYKRQLLNVLNIIHEYLRIVEDDQSPVVAKTFIFAGKAAPGYWAAKQIIKLINNVARVINRDRSVQDMLKVVFVPDYRVSLAEKLIPAADLSEQISTAGKEASGTGNMKFAMNGALTIGTLDGANIEIKEEVGVDNIFIFGLSADEIQQMVNSRTYNPRNYYENDANLKRVLNSLNSNRFCCCEPGLFKWIFDTLLNRDDYFLLADFQSYVETQQKAMREYRKTSEWYRKAILNVARIGRFSSDRTIQEYAEEIWKLKNH